MKYYAGIGSRNTPQEILGIFRLLSKILDKDGYILRSGGNSGSDTAFESGSNNKEIYLPWKNFNNNKSGLYSICSKSEEIAERYYPYWNQLTPAAKKFYARNVYQILGKSLDKPSEFVLYWSSDGAETRTSHITGRTEQAIRIAVDYGIPVNNLQNGKTYYKFKEWIKEVYLNVRSKS